MICICFKLTKHLAFGEHELSLCHFPHMLCIRSRFQWWWLAKRWVFSFFIWIFFSCSFMCIFYLHLMLFYAYMNSIWWYLMANLSLFDVILCPPDLHLMLYNVYLLFIRCYLGVVVCIFLSYKSHIISSAFFIWCCTINPYELVFQWRVKNCTGT